jgi:hypothetical protein
VTSESEGPDDPISMLDVGAISIHTVFQSYLDAGFTRDEAFQLVLEIVKNANSR